MSEYINAGEFHELRETIEHQVKQLSEEQKLLLAEKEGKVLTEVQEVGYTVFEPNKISALAVQRLLTQCQITGAQVVLAKEGPLGGYTFTQLTMLISKVHKYRQRTLNNLTPSSLPLPLHYPTLAFLTVAQETLSWLKLLSHLQIQGTPELPLPAHKLKQHTYLVYKTPQTAKTTHDPQEELEEKKKQFDRLRAFAQAHGIQL